MDGDKILGWLGILFIVLVSAPVIYLFVLAYQGMSK
jgi:hypothetical protein